MASVISSLGAPLLPTIARDDHVSLGDAQWSLTVTMLVGAIFSPLMGRLGDGPKRRTVILVALATVMAGSALAAVAGGSFVALVLGRGLQGLGLGLMPLTMAVARDHLSPARSRHTIALLSIAGAAGVGLGYPVTAILAEVGGLEAAFWFGAAVAGAAMVVAYRMIPRPTVALRRPLDVAGAALLGLALLAVLLAMTQGRTWGWSSPATLTLIVGAVLAAVAWVRQVRRADHPLVDLSLLGRRAVAVTNVTALFMSAAIYTFLPILTDYVQAPRSTGYGLGASVVVAGLMLLPFSVLSTGMSRVAAWVGDRVGESWIIPVGSLVFAATNVYVAVSTHALWEAFVAMGLAGIGMGLTFAAMPGLIVRAVPPEETGSALGFYQVVRYVGFSFGSAVSATILAAATPQHAALPQRSGFTVALLMAAGLAVVAAVVSAWFGRPVEASDQTAPPEARLAHLAELEREEGEAAGAGLPLNTEGATLQVVLGDERVSE